MGYQHHPNNIPRIFQFIVNKFNNNNIYQLKPHPVLVNKKYNDVHPGYYKKKINNNITQSSNHNNNENENDNDNDHNIKRNMSFDDNDLDVPQSDDNESSNGLEADSDNDNNDSDNKDDKKKTLIQNSEIQNSNQND